MSLPAIFSQWFPKKPLLQDQEQLASLFSNRAELKRDFRQQRERAERLAEKLRQQEVATLKAEQRLDKVESMLADPESALQAMTFYQLRNLWFHCRKRSSRFVSELYETQAERERQAFLRDYRSQHEMSLQEVRAELNEISAQADAVAGQMTELAARRTNMSGFWNFFRRREITERIAEFDEARLAVGAEVDRLKGTSEMRKATRPPEFPGLSIAGKRVVNLQLIAFAQELYLWFRQHELPELAREAAICQVTDVRYGDAARCQFLTEHIGRRIRELSADTGLLMRTAERAAWLAKQVEYRNETDTIPESAGLSLLVVLVDKPNEYAPFNVNVLSQEYWDICSVLIPA